MQSWIFFAVITPVFSVTWSFRKYSDMMIWCSSNISIIVITMIKVENSCDFHQNIKQHKTFFQELRVFEAEIL